MKKQEIVQLIKDYIGKIEISGIPVEEAYVFGSSLKGGSRKGSDIDTCIVSSFFGKDRQKERVLLMNLREGISDLIEPHPLSPKDFESKYYPFVAEVKRTGLNINNF